VDTINAGVIRAHQIYVTPSSGSTASQITLEASDSGADLVVHGPISGLWVENSSGSRANLAVTATGTALLMDGPANAGVVITAPTAGLTLGHLGTSGNVILMADGQAASVSAVDPSQRSASMGYRADSPGAFRASDPAVSQTDPVWTAP
jgi:hypothetical protein